MKYEIDGLEKGKTIYKVIDRDNFIEVIYLNGSNDILEKTDDNMQNIRKQMYVQASKYVSTFNDKKYDDLIEQRQINKFSFVCSNLMIVFLTLSALLTNGVVLIICSFFLMAFISLSIILLKEIYIEKRKLRDLEKYNIFIKEFENKIQDFNNIMVKEARLKRNKSNNIKQIDIFNLDKYSLKQLRSMLLKVERYKLLTTNSITDENIDVKRSKTYSKKNIISK